MSSYSNQSNPEHDGAAYDALIKGCVERVVRAPDYVEGAAKKMYPTTVRDPYAIAAEQAQNISDAQRLPGNSGDVVPLMSAEAAASQARLLARPIAQTTEFMQEAA